MRIDPVKPTLRSLYASVSNIAFAFFILLFSVLSACHSRARLESINLVEPADGAVAVSFVKLADAAPVLQSGMSQEQVIDLLGIPAEISRDGSAADTWRYHDTQREITIRFNGDNRLEQVQASDYIAEQDVL